MRHSYKGHDIEVIFHTERGYYGDIELYSLYIDDCYVSSDIDGTELSIRAELIIDDDQWKTLKGSFFYAFINP